MKLHTQAVEIVAAEFNINPYDLTTRCRTAKVSEARHVLYWVLYNQGLSLTQVGSVMGRHHTTVLYACRVVNADPVLLERANRVARWLVATQARKVSA